MASFQKLFRRLLFKAQGYGDNEKIILQYNISAIILENVEALRGNITKHINICYYFVTFPYFRCTHVTLCKPFEQQKVSLVNGSNSCIYYLDQPHSHLTT